MDVNLNRSAHDLNCAPALCIAYLCYIVITGSYVVVCVASEILMLAGELPTRCVVLFCLTGYRGPSEWVSRYLHSSWPVWLCCLVQSAYCIDFRGG